MCKYKDTNLGIKKLDFGLKRGMMAVYLTDGRVVMVPVGMYWTTSTSPSNTTAASIPSKTCCMYNHNALCCATLITR